MSKEDNMELINEKEDKELEDLLDSALEDFSKPLPAKPPTILSPTEETSESSGEQLWNDEFLLEAQKQFEQNMKALFEQGTNGTPLAPEAFEESLQKIAEETTKVLTERSGDPNFSATIAETLRNLSENSENLQSEVSDDISTMLSGLNIGGVEGMSEILPLMQNMMQSFLSKDILYPCIKEVADKYPAWLEENKSNLSESDYNNFNKQMLTMKEVCTEFEKETESDNEETKRKRFTKILSLMEEMQKLGKWPQDLVGGSSPFPFDESAMQSGMLPGMDPSQCSIM